MVSPSASRRRNSSQVAHCGTSSELAMRTRGAHGCVLTTPTGFPDWTSSVSSSSSSRSVATIASNAAQLRAARPEPPYTISSSGCSATSGSRLFMSIRMAASCGQPLQLSPVPRGARTGRGPLVAVIAGSSSSVDAAMIACCWGSASATPNPNTGGYRGSGKTVLRQPALGDGRGRDGHRVLVLRRRGVEQLERGRQLGIQRRVHLVRADGGARLVDRGGQQRPVVLRQDGDRAGHDLRVVDLAGADVEAAGDVDALGLKGLRVDLGEQLVLGEIRRAHDDGALACAAPRQGVGGLARAAARGEGEAERGSQAKRGTADYPRHIENFLP